MEQRDCNASGYEPETEWHQQWKTRIADNDPNRMEVVFTPHRADALSADGWVVELQHSTISQEDIAAREAFYPKVTPGLIWLTDSNVLELATSPVFYDKAGKILGKHRKSVWRNGYVQVLRHGRWVPLFRYRPIVLGDKFLWKPGRLDTTVVTWAEWTHDEFIMALRQEGVSELVARLRSFILAADSETASDRTRDDTSARSQLDEAQQQEAQLQRVEAARVKKKQDEEAAKQAVLVEERRRAAAEWEAGRPAREALLAAKHAEREAQRAELEVQRVEREARIAREQKEQATRQRLWEEQRPARMNAAALLRCRRVALGLSPGAIGISVGQEQDPDLDPKILDKANQLLWKYFLQWMAQRLSADQCWQDLILQGWGARHFREAAWYLGTPPWTDDIFSGYGHWNSE